jgi:hypothetical protein
MTRWGVYLALVAAALVLAATAGGGNGRDQPGSIDLDGKLSGISNFFAPACTSVTGVCSRFSIKGTIKGDGVVFIDTIPTAEGLSHAHTVIHTKRGDLTCSEIAIFDLVGDDHGFVDLCIVTGGTGRYSGASGYIQEVGTFDFTSNVGGGHYHGRLFFPSDGSRRN